MADLDAVTCRAEPIEDGVLVSIAGEIDFSRSPALRTELLSWLGKEPKRMILDLAEVPYMDSSGVATLIEALQVQRNAERSLVLCNLQERVRGIFEIARLNMVFQIADDLDQAKRL